MVERYPLDPLVEPEDAPEDVDGQWLEAWAMAHPTGESFSLGGKLWGQASLEHGGLMVSLGVFGEGLKLRMCLVGPVAARCDDG